MQRAVLMSASVLLATATFGATEPEQASIPFATTSGIQGWRPGGDDTLYIRGRNDQWYKADLFGPCIGLEFDPTIGFVVRYGSSFDRSSSLLVEGRECRVSSLVKVNGPPKGDQSANAGDSRRTNATEARTAANERGRTDAKVRGSANTEARIPFANLGGIEDWRVVNDKTLYVESRNDEWFRVELLSPCTGLQFEQSIGFVAEPTGSFDRFSSIVVDGRECQVSSLTRGTPPGLRQADGALAEKK
jgi:hypothetical protein